MNIPSRIQNIKVLMYHRFTKEKVTGRKNWFYIHIDDFREQLKLLELFNFTPITFEDYKLYLENKLTLPKKPIIITFDDGYLDTYELALPALNEFGMRGVIFVMGDRRLEYSIWDEYEGLTRAELMNDNQILETKSMGFEIAAHTMTHPKLSQLSVTEAREEIEGSKELLESLLGTKLLSFSYPFGLLNEQVRKIVVNAGFNFACGVYTGPPRFGDDWFNIRRITIYNNMSMPGFIGRLVTPYEYLEWLYWKLRNRSMEDISDIMNKPAATKNSYEKTV